VLERGFHLSLEAFFSILLLLNLMALTLPFESQNLNRLSILQKQHDLFKVWLVTKTFDLKEMAKDFQKAFPGFSGKIILMQGKRVLHEEIIGEWAESRKENYSAESRIYHQGEFFFVKVIVQI